MAMRITSKMMQSTSLRNLNTNKALEAKLTNQLATGKKIDRPSDDPVVAIRALRLNASLDKIEQYYGKNASDAESWLDLTSSSISMVNTLLETDITENLGKLKNTYQKADQRQMILDALRHAVGEIYSVGNADSAGRSIFTGFRTDMPLAFKSDKTEKYTITQQITNLDIDQVTFVSTGGLKNINEGNFADFDENEYKVSTNDIYRIRLAYSDIDVYSKDELAKMTPEEQEKYGKATASYGAYINVGYMSATETSVDGAKLSTPSFTAYAKIDVSGRTDKAIISLEELANGASSTVSFAGVTPGSGVELDTSTNPPKLVLSEGATVSVSGYAIKFEDGKISVTSAKTKPQETVSIGYERQTDAEGNVSAVYDDKYLTSLKVDNFYPSSTSDAAYASVMKNPNQMTYVADTGELLLGKDIQKRLSELPNSTELRVSYEKSAWKKNDLDPVHYFYTEKAAPDNPNRTLAYNENFLKDPTPDGKQIIEYDVGSNQSLRVNTTADEFITHDIGRDIDEISTMLENYSVLEGRKEAVEKMIESEKYVGDDLTKLNQELEALNKAMTMVGDKITKRCDKMLEDVEGYRSKAQVADTNCGARGKRLELIQNRLQVQQTSFKELVSDNEDADYSELVIQMKSIQMTYGAALSSISYVMQTSLLDFIR